MPEKVKLHKEIFGTDFPMNGEWDAGVTPFGVSHAGRWTMCRESETEVKVCEMYFFGGKTTQVREGRAIYLTIDQQSFYGKREWSGIRYTGYGANTHAPVGN